MFIQYLNGGLANQTFQYIFSRYLEKNTGEICYLDDSFFFYNQIHNGYELERVYGVKPHLLSEYFSKDVWTHLVENCKRGVGIAQQLWDRGLNLFLVAETSNFEFNGNYIFAPVDEYTPKITWAHGNVYYHGYWLNRNWYEKNEEIKQELKFPPIQDVRNLKYAQRIMESNSIAIHIRRGDFVKLDWALPPGIYKECMAKLSERHPEATYFIFSDDIPWCKKHADELGFDYAKGRLVFVEGNGKNGENYRDLQLMTLCAGMVVTNSSFSCLAAVLNRRMGKNFINITGREI